jgi:hypothetical protein
MNDTKEARFGITVMISIKELAHKAKPHLLTMYSMITLLVGAHRGERLSGGCSIRFTVSPPLVPHTRGVPLSFVRHARMEMEEVEVV